MARILLILENDENRRLLEEWLSECPEYEEVTPDAGGESLTDFDLCIVDPVGLRRHRKILGLRKEVISPLFLPYLLVTGEAERKRLSPDIWGYIDDIVTKPIRKRELANRVDNLLERRRLSLELSDSEAHFETSLDLLPNPVVILDEGKDILNANNRFCELTGISKPELMERSIAELDIFSVNTLDDVLARSKGENHGSSQDVICYSTSEGNTRYATIATSTWLNRDSVIGDIYLLHDITTLVKQQQELRRFREAVEHAGHAIYITDAEGTIEYVNPAFMEMTGYDKEEVIGRDPSILKSGEHSEEFYSELWETILEGDVWKAELVNQRRNGELYQVAQTIAPIFGAEDDIEGFVAVNADITQRNRRDQQVEVLNRVLRHNLRNDLNLALGYIDKALEVIENPEARTAARQASEAFGTLLDISKKLTQIEATTASERKSQPIDLGTLMTQKCTSFENVYTDAEITVDYPEDESIAVDMRVETAIHELLENAIEHNSEPEPRVHVSVDEHTETEDKVRIDIADNGPGFPPHEQAVLRRGEESPLMHGSGLGLWLAYWSIEISGGTIRITDNQPTGSIVTLELPTRNEEVSESWNQSPSENNA